MDGQCSKSARLSHLMAVLSSLCTISLLPAIPHILAAPPPVLPYDLSYDAENHLTRVDKNDVLNIQFAYDGDGERVKAYNASSTTSFIGSWYEWTGTATSYYFLGGKRVAMRDTNGLSWIHGDHLSSARQDTWRRMDMETSFVQPRL